MASQCSTTSLPQQTQQNNFLGTNQFADLIISNFIVNKIGDVMKNDFKLSAVNICKLLVLLSTTELKHYTSVIMSHILTMIKDSPNLFWKVMFVINKYKSRKQNISVCSTSIPLLVIKKTKTVQINTELNFMIALHNHIIKNSATCSFQKTLGKINIKNTKENIFSENFNNIKIKIKNCDLEFRNNISFDLNVCSGNIVGMQIMDKKNEHITSYLGLLSHEQAIIITHVRDYILGAHNIKLNECKRFWELMHPKGYDAIPDTEFSERYIAELICRNYPQFDQYQTMFEIFIFSLILYKKFKKPCISDTLNTLQKCQKMIYDINNKYSVNQQLACYNCWTNRFGNDLVLENALFLWSPTQMQTAFDPVITLLKELLESKDDQPIIKTTITQNNTIPITISSNDDIDEKTIMTEFIKNIYESYKKSNDTIKIHSLQLEEKITIKEDPNPEYANWEEKKIIRTN